MILPSIMWKFILVYILAYPFFFLTAAKTGFWAYLAFLCPALTYIFTQRKRIDKNPLNLIVTIFFLNIFVSAFFSRGLAAALGQIYKYLPLLILFHAVSLIKENERFRLARILVLGGALVSLYGLYAFFVISEYMPLYITRHNINYPFAREFLSRGRAFAPFITPNLLAGYLAMIIFIAGGMFLANKNKAEKVISSFCLSVSLPAFFLTKSISGWVCAAFVPAFLLFFDKKISKKNAAFIFTALTALLAVFILRVKETKIIASPLFSLQQRFSYWAQTIEIIKQHPLKGSGAGSLSLKETLSSHNSYLQIWAEQGLVGLLAWLAIIFIFIKLNITLLKTSDKKQLRAGLFFGGLFFLLHNFLDFSFFIPQAAFLWWVILGLTAGNYADIRSNNK